MIITLISSGIALVIGGVAGGVAGYNIGFLSSQNMVKDEALQNIAVEQRPGNGSSDGPRKGFE